MRILSMDTALQGCAVGLYDSETGLSEENILPMERGQAEHLIPMIEDMITEYDALDLIAVTQGPGAFAGLRIGLMSAKTFAMVLNIPVVGVSTFDCMFAISNADMVVLETKRQDYYAQIKGESPACMHAQDIEDKSAGQGITIIGNANDRLKSELNQMDHIIFKDVDLIPPHILSALAIEKYTADPAAINAEPIYLRGPEIGTPKRKNRKIAKH